MIETNRTFHKSIMVNAYVSAWSKFCQYEGIGRACFKIAESALDRFRPSYPFDTLKLVNPYD